MPRGVDEGTVRGEHVPVDRNMVMTCKALQVEARAQGCRTDVRAVQGVMNGSYSWAPAECEGGGLSNAVPSRGVSGGDGEELGSVV